MIAVVGAGLSLTGYNESLQLTTSTGIVTLTSTETRIVTTSLLSATYHQNTIKLEKNDCLFAEVDFYVEGRQAHVSYSVSGGTVDFWLLDDHGLGVWKGDRPVMQWGSDFVEGYTFCQGDQNFHLLYPVLLDYRHSINGLLHDFRSSGHDFTVEIPSSGTYHIIFLNPYKSDATIIFNVDTISPSTITGYSTQTNTIATEMMKPAGLGMSFFSGIGLVAVAVIAIAVAMKRKGRTAPVRRPLRGHRVSSA